MHCKNKYLKCMKMEQKNLYQQIIKCVYCVIIFWKHRKKCDQKGTMYSRYICLNIVHSELKHGSFCFIMNIWNHRKATIFSISRSNLNCSNGIYYLYYLIRLKYLLFWVLQLSGGFCKICCVDLLEWVPSYRTHLLIC